LESLLRKTPEKRLGSDPNNPVRNHPWFEDVNWQALLEKKYDAPFVPKINDENDLQNFDPEFTEMPVNSMSMGESGMKQFRSYDGFTYDDENKNMAMIHDAMVIEEN
jgi:serum/glucocorticoid-regulated kinase 2